MKKICIAGAPIIIIALALFSPARSSNIIKIKNTHAALSSGNTVMPTDSASAVLRGKTVYKTYCLSCHQFDAGGVENLNPPLIKTPFVLGNKAGLIQIILKGFDKRVEIDGEQYSNNMPPLNFLTNQQIADVLTYVRNDFGNKATAVRASEVQIVRGRLAK